MKSKLFGFPVSIIAVLALASGVTALAETPDRGRDVMRFRGVINDFTPASTVRPAGPWEVRGHWSLVVKGRYGEAECKAHFSAALTMERSDQGMIENGDDFNNTNMDRMQHTHHITLDNAEVTTIPGGFRVKGPATVTANGAFPPPFGSDPPMLTIDIVGGTGPKSVRFSNITLLFGEPASGHLGTQPLHGVVVRRSDRDDRPRR
jgi:hypothetical protein